MGAGEMGCSKCAQCCDRGVADRIVAHQSPARPVPHGVPKSAPQSGEFATQSLLSLSYVPPPPADSRQDVNALLGSHFVPPRPPKLVLGDTSSQREVPAGAEPISCARPGEPPNKVYVQFSNDLEGFLPYTLLISEEQGLEFASLSASPDFSLDPLNFIEVSRVRYDALMHDAFFLSLSRSIRARPDLQHSEDGLAHQSGSSEASDWRLRMQLEERVRPPYKSMVQLSVRRALVEGGQVLVFIAVQSEPLAEELANSCRKLRKGRTARARRLTSDLLASHDEGHGQSRSPTPTRGCPTPRTVASRTPPSMTPPRLSPRTPLRAAPAVVLAASVAPEGDGRLQPPLALRPATPPTSRKFGGCVTTDPVRLPERAG